MRVLLRIVAGFTLLSVVFTVLFLFAFWQRGGLAPLISTGPFGLLTFLAWLVTLFLGPIATVKLWRFRASGRVAAAVVWGSTALYYLLGLLFFRTPGTLIYQAIVAFGFSAVLLVLLLLPAARRACLPAAYPPAA